MFPILNDAMKYFAQDLYVRRKLVAIYCQSVVAYRKWEENHILYECC